MEFRILRKPSAFVDAHKPDKLTPSERIELIKQLCPEINNLFERYHYAGKQADYERIHDKEHPYLDILNKYPTFTDYLTEQMEKK